ncbi:type IV conjugative transfer system protein TraE, partial [Thiorhodococcus minor]
PLLSPKLRRAVAAILDDQVEALQRDRVSVRFAPELVQYEAASDRVRVSGKQVITGPGADPVTRPRTYEVQVAFRNYRPLITHLDAYQDARARKDRTADATTVVGPAISAP